MTQEITDAATEEDAQLEAFLAELNNEEYSVVVETPKYVYTLSKDIRVWADEECVERGLERDQVEKLFVKRNNGFGFI